MKIRDVMTTDIRSAELDTTIEELATIMRDEDVGSVPILEDDELRGIVTDRDIVVRCIAEGMDIADTTVEDILSEDLKTVSPNQDSEEAARLMADLQVRRLPVVEKGRLVGMVSIGDLAVKSDTDDDRIGRTLEEVSEGVKASGEDAERASRSGFPARTARGQMRQNSNARKQQGGAKRQQPGSATQTTERTASQVRGSKPAGVVGGGRQETMEAESGRHARSTRGRIEAEQGNPPRNQKSSGQGIANRSAGEEKKRQERVVNIGGGKARSSQRKKAS